MQRALPEEPEHRELRDQATPPPSAEPGNVFKTAEDGTGK